MKLKNIFSIFTVVIFLIFMLFYGVKVLSELNVILKDFITLLGHLGFAIYLVRGIKKDCTTAELYNQIKK